jgi:oxalate decarboxylase/phosphoglucose isomerase-like protein (cupin superfamily)
VQAQTGEIRGLTFRGEAFEWIEIASGDVFHVPGGAKHAFRNDGADDAVMLIVSTAKIGRIQRFLETSARYGYWNATPEENARIGIRLPF